MSDEHEGKGGSYVVIDGQRKLVERTAPRPERDGAAQPETAPAEEAPRKQRKG